MKPGSCSSPVIIQTPLKSYCRMMLRADLQILENLERGSAEFAPPQVHHNKVPSVTNLQRAIFFLFYGDFCLVSVYSRENISSDLNIG